MKKIDKKNLFKSFLIVSGGVIGLGALALILSKVPTEALVPVLGLAGFITLWYIVYDLLS
jgi:hypothetical protein